MFHAWSKQIQLRYDFIRELISGGILSLMKILKSNNPLDMLTNVVITEKLNLCNTLIDL